MKQQSKKIYKLLNDNKLFNKTINFDLKRIKKALHQLSHPEKKLKNVINIIGSDGKYTLLTCLKYFIEANKNTVSSYTSPSLKDIKERFWMGKNFLSHKEIKRSIIQIEKLNIPLTIFEVLTLIFILNAVKRDNNFNLIEAGALFAKDSTNVFNFPLIQAVTNINKQHLNFLKIKTIDEIIFQKVGFLNQSTNIYIGKQSPSILRKIKKRLIKNKSNKIFPETWMLIRKNNNYFYNDKKIRIKIKTKHIFSLGLLENLCMAIKIALDLKIKKKVIEKTIPKIILEGRIQYLNKGKIKKMAHKNEKIILDGAHSKKSAQNLANYLNSIKGPKYGIWGMMKYKEHNIFINQFKNIFKKVFTIPIEGEKMSMSNLELNNIAKKNNLDSECSKNFQDALKKIKSNEKKTICIFGSLYLCGNVLNKN